MLIFEDGRIIYDKSAVVPEEKGKYLEVETLPEIPPIEGKAGYWVADLKTKKLKAKYYAAPELPPEPMPEVPPPLPPLPPPITTEDVLLAVAELAEKQEADNLNMQLAVAELAEISTMGGEK